MQLYTNDYRPYCFKAHDRYVART